MPTFGRTSRERLETCHVDLQRVLHEVIKHYDCSVLCGHRTRQEQELKFSMQLSKVEWPNSKHNAVPSLAVDVVPWYVDSPHIRWSEREDFTLLAGHILGIGAHLGVELLWGGNWARDFILGQNDFDDMPHYQVVQAP